MVMSTPSVAMTRTSELARRSGRITTQCVRTPRNADHRMPAAADNRNGQPASECNSDCMKTPAMAVAPSEKFKTPVPRYTTMRPCDAKAYKAPTPSPSNANRMISFIVPLRPQVHPMYTNTHPAPTPCTHTRHINVGVDCSLYVVKHRSSRLARHTISLPAAPQLPEREPSIWRQS